MLSSKVTPGKKALSSQDALPTDLLKSTRKTNSDLEKLHAFEKHTLQLL